VQDRRALRRDFPDRGTGRGPQHGRAALLRGGSAWIRRRGLPPLRPVRQGDRMEPVRL